MRSINSPFTYFTLLTLLTWCVMRWCKIKRAIKQRNLFHRSACEPARGNKIELLCKFVQTCTALSCRAGSHVCDRKQDGHSPGKPGKVREFKSSQGKFVFLHVRQSLLLIGHIAGLARLSVYCPFLSVFENTYFTFFSDFKKNMTFYVFLNDLSKKRKKSLAKI